MSNLKDIHVHIQQAEQALAELVKEEEALAASAVRDTMYVFTYEQAYDDAEGWHPNYQLIQAASVGRAFAVFGRVLDEMHLTVRTVNYGLYSEMFPAMDEISDYWREHHKRNKEETAK